MDLVSHGSDEVLEGVVRNAGARISETTLFRVVERSQNNEKIQAPLIERPDLPFEMMQDMFDQVSMNLKQKILAQAKEIAPEKLDSLLNSARAKFDRKGNASQQPALGGSPDVHTIWSTADLDFTAADGTFGAIDLLFWKG